MNATRVTDAVLWTELVDFAREQLHSPIPLSAHLIREGNCTASLSVRSAVNEQSAERRSSVCRLTSETLHIEHTHPLLLFNAFLSILQYTICIFIIRSVLIHRPLGLQFEIDHPHHNQMKKFEGGGVER